MKIHATADDLARANKTISNIRANLKRIVTFYEPALDGKSSTDENDRKPTVTAGEPASIEAITARADANTDLRFWAGFILDEVNQGTIATIVRPEIRDMAEFVERWATALVDQFPDDADRLQMETRRHADRLENLARGWGVRRIELGKCPEVALDETQAKCTGNLWAVLHNTDKALLPKHIICDKEGKHQWSPHLWRDLGRRLDASLTLRLQLSQSAEMSAPSNAGSKMAS